ENTMTKTTSDAARTNRHPIPDSDVVMTRLRQHLDFLRLSHTKKQLQELLAWARKNQPGATELLEHVLGAEVASKRDARIERRITTSGLCERKLLETFDWD